MQMTIARWKPPVAPTRQEQFLLKRLDRVRKLLGFLRVHPHELFDDAFQDELASMYRTTGAGKDALPPAMMAMAMVAQGGCGSSEAERVGWTGADVWIGTVVAGGGHADAGVTSWDVEDVSTRWRCTEQA